MAISASEWLQWAIAFGVYPPDTAGGSVTEVDTGAGLTGGPITSTGSISFAPIAAHSFWANITGGIAVPTVQPLSSVVSSTLTAAHFFVGNASNVATDVAMSGDASLNNAGAVTVASIGGKAVSLAGTFTTAGAFALTLTVTNTTNATLPVGTTTLVPTAGTGATGVWSGITGLGAQSQALNMNAHLINGVVDPVSAQDAMTLHYAGITYLALAGGTMSGAINMGSHQINAVTDPTSAQDAMTLHYAGITYLALAGGTMTGDISLGGAHRVTNALDPSGAQDYATKNYVDQTSLNGTSVYAATTTNLNVTQSGAGPGATLTDASGTFAPFSTDSVSPPVGSNTLVKNLAAPQHEGIYTLTTNGDGISIPYQLTRATSYDTDVEINNTGLIFIQNGSSLALTAWANLATIVTVDTTAFNYAQFGPGGTVTSVATGTGLTGGPVTSTGTISVLPTLHSISGTTVLDATDYQKTIVMTGSSPYTVTLPAHSAGTIIEFVSNTTSNALVTLSPASGTINGQATIVLGTYDNVTLYDDGTNYTILRQSLQPVNFQAYIGTTQTVTGTLTTVTYDTKNYDVGTFYNTGTATYTPGYPGKFKFYATLIAAPTTSYLNGEVLSIAIYKNGASVLQKQIILTASSSTGESIDISETLIANGSSDAFLIKVSSTSIGTPTTAAFSLVSCFEASRIALF